MKRHRRVDSVGEGGSSAKSTKTAPGSTATGPAAQQSSDTHQELKITVNLRSAKKAARNDPGPLPLLQEERQRILYEAGLPQPTGNTENPVVPDNPRISPREASSDEINEGEDSELGDDQSDEDEDDGEDLEDIFEFDEFPWYEELDGLATLKPSTDAPTGSRREKRQIGSCTAKLIRRGMIRESFWTEMDEPTGETHDLAFNMFDRYGRLNPEFYEHDVNKGTGVWGKELDRGDILLFELLQVDAAHRRRGVGAKLVNAILEKTRKKVSDSVGLFALTRPESLWREIRLLENEPEKMKEAEAAAKEDALAFFRSMGFRRIGASPWFAWTDSPGHPSRQLAIAEDFNPPDYRAANAPLADAALEQTFRRLLDPEVEAAECIEELTKTFPEDFEDDQWQTTVPGNNNLLHIASIASRPEVVSFLLSRVPSLAAVRNKNGHTPLEALQAQLERLRTRQSNGDSSWITSDKFKGFVSPSIACLAAMQQTTICDLSILSPQSANNIAAFIDDEMRGSGSDFDLPGIRKALRYKYGCTCGQCMGGLLSPRMKYALLCVADIEHDNMHDFADGNGLAWVIMCRHLLTHHPGRVQENLKTNKSMRQGFANMFSHFASCLRRDKLPTEARILHFYRNDASEWPPVTKNYLERGGSVAAVANAIFQTAMEQDEWAGDGTHRRIFGEHIDELVTCRNDHEFGFVAGMCGYKRVKPGPRRVDLLGIPR